MPKKPDFRPLATQLTQKNVAIISASLFAVLVLTNIMIWYLTLNKAMADAQLNAKQLANQIEILLVFEDKGSVNKELANYAEFRPVENIAVFLPDNSGFAVWPLPEVTEPLAIGSFAHKEASVMRNSNSLLLQTPIKNKQDLLGLLVITENLTAEFNWLMNLTILQSAVILAVLFIAGLWLKHTHKMAFKPLAKLSQLAEQVTLERNFSLRAAVEHQDDIGKLAVHLNELLKRLEFWQQEQQQQLAQQKAIGNEMRILAHFDSLTKLANRLGFNKDLNDLFAKAQLQQQTLALLFIDLDKFKFVNDTYGHQAGDHVLQTFANRLSKCIRTDDRAYRLAGDEFAVLLSLGTEQEAVTQVALRIIDHWQQPVYFHNQVMPVACSIGIALFPLHADTPEALLEKADIAMYQAKRSGRGKFCFYEVSL